MTSLQL